MINKILEKTSRLIPQIVVYGGLILLLLDDSIHATFGIGRFIPIENRISLLIAVTASLTWMLSYYIKRVDLSIHELSKLQKDTAEIIDLWGEVNISERYKNAELIRILNLAGTQFAKLGSQKNLESIFTLTKIKKIEILVGDPYGEGVKLRYKHGFGEPSTYETGLVGIDRKLRDLYNRWTNLPSKFKSKVKIRVFKIYPTVSLVQIDHDYYSATYGYELRGGDCPKVHTVRGSIYSKFLDKHFENVFNNATPIEEWIRNHPENEYET